MRLIYLASAVSSLVLTACSPGGNPADEPDAGEVVQGGALDDCLDLGGDLEEVSVIDNNVVIAHGEIRSFALSSAGQIAVGSTDGAIKLWSILDPNDPTTTGNGVGYDASFGEGTPVFGALAYTADGSWIAGGSEVGEVSVWSTTTGDNLGAITVGELAITSVAPSPTGDRVAFADASFAGNVRVWNRASGEVSDALVTELWAVNALAWVPSTGALVLAGDWYGVPMVELRDAADPTVVIGSWLNDIEPVTGTILDIALTADESRVVFAGNGFVGDVDLASLADPEPSGRLLPNEHLASSVALTPGETYAVSAGDDGMVRVFDRDTLADRVELAVDGLVAVHIDTATDQIVTAHMDGHIRLIRCAGQ